jgi:4-amino-4-deoxy-L-arabinose transferase-like glycosyltransferase
MLPRLSLPPSPAILAALAAAFILPGLVNHDLWKSQDAIGLGIVYDMALSGDLIVPHIAGEPWLEDAPLYHWFALAFGRVFGFLMPFHTAARLASGAFVAAAFALVYFTARGWSEPDAERRTTAAAALLILLGSVGLMVHAHEALPQLASLAAICGAFATLPYAASRPLRAGIAFGVALGLAFLSATWIAPAAVALAVAIAHFACPEWRTRNAAIFLAAALACGTLVSLTWPLALALSSSAAFVEWWGYTWRMHGTLTGNLRHLAAIGSWFTWPAWPLALWAAWSLRRRLREPRLFVPALAIVLMAALQIRWGPPQDKNFIPLLAPLALLAANAVFTLRRGAMAALDWFGVLSFGFFTALVWLGYSAMTLGIPGPMARNFARIAPGFAAHFQPLPVLIAALLFLAWLYLIFFTPFSPLRSVARWAGGIVLLWGSFALLWMPWVDYQKSYRAVAIELRSKIPVGTRCLAQRWLGVSQAAALDYHGGIRAQPFDLARPNACPLVLVQGSPNNELGAPVSTASAKWVKLADVGRPGDRAERYRLYRLGK